MALITTTLTPLATQLPFIAPAPSIELWETQVPRGEIVFVEQAAAITIAGVGDDQKLQINCDLPRGFAYVLVGSNMMITGADVAQWQNNASFRLRDSNDAASARWTIHQRYQADSTVMTIGATLNKVYELESKAVSKVILCNLSVPGQLKIQVRNITTDQAAGTVDFFARFFQYDLNQAFRWAVNSPVLVR